MTNFHSFPAFFRPWSGTSYGGPGESNLEGKIRSLGLIPSNLQVIYHRMALVIALRNVSSFRPQTEALAKSLEHW
jgi:hypothetical protein